MATEFRHIIIGEIMNTSIPNQLKAVLILIAVFSFAISYNNLHEMAIQMGIPHYLAWFFPLCIDLFLIACSIFILYAEERCPEESREGWIFLITYTVLSIWYNVLHSPPEFWYQVGFAICPISLCVSLHLFIKVVKHEMKQEVKIEEIKVEDPVVVEKVEQKTKTDIMREYYTMNPSATYAEATRETGISYKTLKAFKDGL